MVKNQSQQEKILKRLAAFFFALTLLFSLSAAVTNALYLFLFAFTLFYWQRSRLQKLLARLTERLSPFLAYLLLAVFWSAVLEVSLARLNFLVSLGFYLPYFIIWYFLIAKFEFNFLEVFYLAGVSGILFGFFITKQLLVPFVIHTNLKIALLAFGARMITTLPIYGALVGLPYLLLLEKENSLEKPLKHYLLAAMTTFLVLPFFLVWSKLVSLLQ